MKPFIVYKDNGQIVRHGYCKEADYLNQKGDGELILEGEVGLGFSYISNGAVVEAPPCPSRAFVFDYINKQWVDPRSPEELLQRQWIYVRSRRDSLLAACDWTQLPDVPIETKSAWAAYRQSLRDITSQTDPYSIIWPVSP